MYFYPRTSARHAKSCQTRYMQCTGTALLCLGTGAGSSNPSASTWAPASRAWAGHSFRNGAHPIAGLAPTPAHSKPIASGVCSGRLARPFYSSRFACAQVDLSSRAAQGSAAQMRRTLAVIDLLPPPCGCQLKLSAVRMCNLGVGRLGCRAGRGKLPAFVQD